MSSYNTLISRKALLTPHPSFAPQNPPSPAGEGREKRASHFCEALKLLFFVEPGVSTVRFFINTKATDDVSLRASHSALRIPHFAFRICGFAALFRIPHSAFRIQKKPPKEAFLLFSPELLLINPFLSNQNVFISNSFSFISNFLVFCK